MEGAGAAKSLTHLQRNHRQAFGQSCPLLLDLETSGPQHVPFEMMHTRGGGHGPATIINSRGGQTRDSPGTSCWSQLGKLKRLHRLGKESDGLIVCSVPFPFILSALLQR